MDDKQAARIILGLLKKGDYSQTERKALESAIGVLGWTSLSQSRLKNRKDKLDKSARW